MWSIRPIACRLGDCWRYESMPFPFQLKVSAVPPCFFERLLQDPRLIGKNHRVVLSMESEERHRFLVNVSHRTGFLFDLRRIRRRKLVSSEIVHKRLHTH